MYVYILCILCIYCAYKVLETEQPFWCTLRASSFEKHIIDFQIQGEGVPLITAPRGYYSAAFNFGPKAVGQIAPLSPHLQKILEINTNIL